MKSKMLVHFSIALLLAGAAGYFSFVWISAHSKAPAQAEAPKPTTVPVVVAAKDIPRGAKLARDMLKVLPYMPESLPPDHFNDVDKLLERVAVASLRANEPVLESRLVSTESGMSGVSPLIKAGKRAMGVKGDRVLGLGGFVRPGNKVDVMVTLDKSAPDEKPVTKLVLENIPVLASGTELDHTGNSEEPSPVEVYSLEVSPEQAEVLALASTQGTLHFALRNDADEKNIKTGGMQIPELLAQQGGMRGFGAAKGGNKRKVEVIAGSARATIEF